MLYMWLYRPYPIDLWWNPSHIGNKADVRKTISKKYDIIFDGLVPHQHIQLISKLTIQILQPRVTYFIEDTFGHNPFWYYKNDIINVMYDHSKYTNTLEKKYASYFIGTKDTHHLLPTSQWWEYQWINTIEWNIKKHVQFHHYFINAHYSKQIAMIMDIINPVFDKTLIDKMKKIIESTPKEIFIKDALKSI